VSPAARVFSALQADDVLLPGRASALRRSSALFLAAMVLVSAPLFWAANASGLIGDVPTAIAKDSDSGFEGDDDSSGSGSDGDDDLTATDDSAAGPATAGTTADDGEGPGAQQLATDETSANGQSTRGTTDDNDTMTKLGTDDTSANGQSTRGTTNDNDTVTKLGTDDTSANGEDTRGTTNDNDTRTVAPA
jgi:hypothetical protein